MFLTTNITKVNSNSLLDENLNIYQFQNNKALLDFQYKFELSNSEDDAQQSFEGIYPIQFKDLFRHNP